MKRTLLATALTVVLASALAPAFAADPVCRKGTIEMAGIKQPLLGFAWDGKPVPLSKGIMFETLLDRRSGDKDFVALVAPESCSVWKAAAGVEGLIQLRFQNRSGQALVLGDGNAVVKVESCNASATRLVVRVDQSFNIGMPPAESFSRGRRLILHLDRLQVVDQSVDLDLDHRLVL